MKLSTEQQQICLDAVRQIVGDRHVLTGDSIPETHCTDWFKTATVTPLALVRPGSPEEVSKVMAVCHQFNQPVTPQGGMTGLVAGATPEDSDVALSLARLSGVEEVDEDACTMTVLAGTPLQTAQEAAKAAGLLLAVDLGARGSCQVGGNVATNAGGNRVIRYGMFRDQVLGLEAVLADGTVVGSQNKMLKNNAGYDLKHLFIGSEGTLGIVTRVVLRLHPMPKSCETALCTAADYQMVVRFLNHAKECLGGTLSAFEVMWPDFHELVADRVLKSRSPISPEGLQILIEMEGSDAGHDASMFSAMLEQAFEQGLLIDASIAQSLKDRDAFWRLRDSVSEFPLMWSPYCGYDVSLPIGDIGHFVDALQQQLHARFAHCEHVHFGHIGDSNLHIGVHIDSRWGAFPEADIDRCVYDLLKNYGGSVSAEHGIGSHKRSYLGHSRTTQEIDLMRTLKVAIDPKNLLNRGKVLA